MHFDVPARDEPSVPEPRMEETAKHIILWLDGMAGESVDVSVGDEARLHRHRRQAGRYPHSQILGDGQEDHKEDEKGGEYRGAQVGIGMGWMRYPVSILILSLPGSGDHS